MYDEKIAGEIEGKYLLIGISYFNAEGKLESTQQLHGEVKGCSREVLVVALQGSFAGEKVQLPADTRTIKKATAGIYKLGATGEEIESPDYLCTFEVHK